MSFLHRSWNLGNFLVLTGVAALGVAVAMPYATARRTARVEGHADRIARALRDAARRHDTAWLASPTAAADLLAALPGDMAARLHPLEADPPPVQPGLYFEGKHYLYVVRRLQNDDQRLRGPLVERQPLEVYAWPRSYLGPGRSAFYASEDGQVAFTRNLQAAYAGLETLPPPGCGRRRETGPERGRAYRGQDDERWILSAL